MHLFDVRRLQCSPAYVTAPFSGTCLHAAQLTAQVVLLQVLCMKRGAGSGATELDPVELQVSVVPRPGSPAPVPRPARPQADVVARLSGVRPARDYSAEVEPQPDGSVWLTRVWRDTGHTVMLVVPLAVMRHLAVDSTIVRPPPPPPPHTPLQHHVPYFITVVVRCHDIQS